MTKYDVLYICKTYVIHATLLDEKTNVTYAYGNLKNQMSFLREIK